MATQQTGTARAVFRHAVALLSALTVVLAACADGDLFNPNAGGPTRLALRPYFSTLVASTSIADIHRIRLTVRELPAGNIVRQEIVDVDPTDDGWNVDLDVPPNSELEVLIELINVAPGNIETVAYSGIVQVSVTTGEQPPPPPVPVFPGGPENLTITSVAISPRDRNVVEGDVVDLTASVIGTSNPTLVWASLNSGVATVEATGGATARVTARGPGRAIIAVVAGPRTDNITINVGALATRIDVQPGAPTLTSLNSDVTFTGRPLDVRNNEVAGLGITWSIADGTIATQVGPGVFRARRNGTTTVTATAVQNGRTITGTATLKVEQRPVSITLNPARADLTAIGATATFTARAVDGNNNEITGFTWSSTNTAVATVDNGVVTARGIGTTMIRAALGGVSAEAEVTVTPTATTLLVIPDQARLTAINATLQLRVEARDALGNLVTGQVTFASALPGVASVDANGLVTANGDGLVVITAAIGSARGFTTINVDRIATGVRLGTNEITLPAGNTFALTAVATDANGFDMPETQVQWLSNNPSVATVNRTTGVVTGVARGDAEVSASAGTGSAVVQVHVTAPVGNGRFAGRVVDFNGTAINGATVTFTQGATSFITEAGPDGTYLSPLLGAGSWDITAAKPTFVSTTFHGAVVVPNSTVTIENLVLVPFSTATGSISGTVRNARTTSSIANAIVELRVGQNVTTGEPIATTTANGSGVYQFSNLQAQVYTLVARPPGLGFSDGFRTGVVVGDAARTNQDIVLTPLGNPSEIYMVLTWGANPRDLDSHLTGPNGAGGRFHVYYANSGSLTSFPFASLDVDDTSGFGPETVTISQMFAGTYRYYIHHYSGSESIATAGATVRVYRGSTLLATFSAPNQPGRIWQVFEYDGTTITPIQTISDSAPARRSPFDLTDAQRVLLDVEGTPKRPSRR